MGQQRRDIARESETAEHLEMGPGVVAGGYAKSQDTRETNRVDV